MSPRYLPPDHPRAMFAGDAERDLARVRAQQQGTPSDHGATVADLHARIADIEGCTAAQQQRAGGPDPGHVIADIPRTDGSVVRVAVKLYSPDGAQQQRGPAVFVDVRQWSGAWPLKGKGLSLRPRELARVAAALLDAAEHIARTRGAP